MTSANGLPIAYAFLVVVYLSLAVAVFWLLRRLSRRSPQSEVSEEMALEVV